MFDSVVLEAGLAEAEGCRLCAGPDWTESGRRGSMAGSDRRGKRQEGKS